MKDPVNNLVDSSATPLNDSGDSDYLLNKIPKKYFQGNGNHRVGDWILRIPEINKQLGKTILFEDTELHIKAGEKIALI